MQLKFAVLQKSFLEKFSKYEANRKKVYGEKFLSKRKVWN